jgi:hypothetical protein
MATTWAVTVSHVKKRPMEVPFAPSPGITGERGMLGCAVILNRLVRPDHSPG